MPNLTLTISPHIEQQILEKGACVFDLLNSDGETVMTIRAFRKDDPRANP